MGWKGRCGLLGDREIRGLEEQSLKPKDLVEILELSKGTISKILNYHKGLSKNSIRRLSEYFKVTQEAFNRLYKLIRPDQHKALIA